MNFLAAAPPAMSQCQCSEDHSSAPSAASSTTAIGTRRLVRYNLISREPAAAPAGPAASAPAADAARRGPVQDPP